MTQSAHPGQDSWWQTQFLRRAFLTVRKQLPGPETGGKSTVNWTPRFNWRVKARAPHQLLKGETPNRGPVRLTIGCSHLPPPSHAVQPNGGALGKCERPEPGRNRFVGRHLVSWHGRPGCWLQKESKRLWEDARKWQLSKLFTHTQLQGAQRSHLKAPRRCDMVSPKHVKSLQLHRGSTAMSYSDV